MPADSVSTGHPNRCSMPPTCPCSSAGRRSPTSRPCARGQRRSSAPPWTGTSRRVLLIGEGQPYNARDVTAAVNLPVLASLADDPESAAVFSRGAQPPKRFETGPLARALTAAIASIHSTITRRRNELLEGARS